MKKITITLSAVLFLMAFSVYTFADNIGYIDMDRLLMSYKGAQEVQSELQNKREEYQNCCF